MPVTLIAVCRDHREPCDQTEGLFQDMMEQASTEVGFEASDLPLMIEAIPVSMDCIVLMITKVEDADEMDTKFSSFTHLNEIFSDDKEMPEAPSAEDRPVRKDLFSSVTASSMERLFSFDSLDTVIRFAHHVSDIYHGENSLYKCPDNNRYYLLLSKSSHNIKEFGLVCNSALEYGSKEFYNFARGAYLNEHYEKILIGDAIQSLAFV